MINVKANKEAIIKRLKSTNREGMENLLAWLESTDFFVAPASAGHHLAIEGGLSEHSLSMYKTFRRLNKGFNIGLPIDSMIISGLLHDVCKINTYVKKEDGGYSYSTSANRGHGLRSVNLIEKYIKLTDSEEAMIRWHMGHYTYKQDGDYRKKENEIQKKFPECYLIHWADHLSSLFLEK